MCRNPFLAFYLISGLFLSNIYAQADIEGLPLSVEFTLDEAVSHALEYNLNLQKTRIDLGASGYSERNLWSEIFPSISASASVSYGSPMFSGGFDLTGGFERVNIGINFSLNAGIPYSIRNIQLAHQGNILRYEDACNQLSIQVTKKYYSLIAEKNNLLLLEEVLNLAQRTFERNQISFNNGLIGELGLLQSRLAYENARYNLSVANTAHENSMAEFLSMLGMDQNTKLALSGEIDIVRISADAEALIREYLPRRPDIVRSMQEIEQLQNNRRQQLMQARAPSVSLSFGWSSSNFDPFMDRLSGTASISIPIDSWIPGTSKSQSLSRAEDSIEKAILDFEIAENAAKTQIRSLTATLNNSWDSILIARLSYEAAQRSYLLTEQGYNNGMVEAAALENARNDMAGARQRLIQSELAYFNTILDLSAAVNMDWKYLMQIYGS